MKCWDMATRDMISKYEVSRNIVTTLQTSPTDPNTLYQGSEDLFVRICKFVSVSVIEDVGKYCGACFLMISSESNLFIVGDTRSATGSQPVGVITGYVYFPVSMDVRNDGNILATGCKGFDSVGCTVKVWDLRNTSKVVAELGSAHSQDVIGCQFIRNGPCAGSILSASKDGSVAVWDFNGMPEAPTVLFSTGRHLTGLCCLDQADKYNAGKIQFTLSCNNGSLLVMSVDNQTNSICQHSIDNATNAYFNIDEGA